jgi:serine/threonine protein kinase
MHGGATSILAMMAPSCSGVRTPSEADSNSGAKLEGEVTEDMFDLSAHGATAFAPPEFHEAWDESRHSIQVTSTAAARVDVYSLGLVLEYMLRGERRDRLGTASAEAVEPSCCMGCFFKPPPPMKYRDESEIPPEAAQLIRDMTKEVATERISLLDIAAHPWVVGDTPAEEPDTQVV